MGRGRGREPRRHVHRTKPTLTLASTQAPSVVGREAAVEGPDEDLVALEDLIGPATTTILATLAEARSPLAAEMVLCGAFGAVRDGMPDASEQDRLEALEEMLSQLIRRAETLGSAPALALLRVCSVLGPATTRAAAQQSARRLAAAGVPDRPWAGTLGHPDMLRAWRYGDVFGAQSSIGVQFDYRGREHVVMVLIDHVLGGGVKDCWVSEGRAAKTLRTRVAGAMANDPDTFFEDIRATDVVTLLGAALAHPPCPEQDDQIEDVDAYLGLLQARVEHIAQLAGAGSGG